MPPSVISPDQNNSNPRPTPSNTATAASRGAHPNRTNTIFIVLTVFAIASELPLLLLYLFGDSLGAGGFGLALFAALSSQQGTILLSAIPFAWLTVGLFKRSYIPRHRQILASVWTISCALIAVVMQYTSRHSGWYHHIQSVGGAWVSASSVFYGLQLGLVGTPVVLLLWLGFRDYRSGAGSKLGAILCIAVGVFCATGYPALLVLNYKAAHQKHVFTIYLPGTANTDPYVQVWTTPFATTGPASVRVTTNYGDLFETAARGNQTRDPKTGLCLPLGYSPDSENFDKIADYKCFAAFTTRNGIKVYEDGSAGKANYRHFFVIGSTFFDLRTYQPDSNVAIVVDSLVPANVDGTLPANNDVSTQVRPSKTIPDRKVGIYLPRKATITKRNDHNPGIAYTANFSQTVTNGVINGFIAEGASEIAKASCDTLSSSCQEITTPNGLDATCDSSTCTVILNYSVVKLSALTITSSNPALQSKLPLSQSQINALIDSLEPTPTR
jgi:hypothetical protein